MIADTDAREAGYKFNYSEAEWGAIADAAKRLHPEGLPFIICKRILAAAHRYRLLVDEHKKQAKRRSPKQRATLYTKISRLFRELSAAVREVENPEEPVFSIRDCYEPPYIKWLKECEMREALRPRTYDSRTDTNTIYIDGEAFKRAESEERQLEFQSTLHVLEVWAWRAKAHAMVGSGRGMILSGLPYEKREHERARKLFYKELLAIWQTMGGKLSISRGRSNSRHRESRFQVSGPLLRFFLAVARPVMGENAPRPETIAGIVSRHRRKPNSPTEDIAFTDQFWDALKEAPRRPPSELKEQWVFEAKPTGKLKHVPSTTAAHMVSKLRD
jgi:hypothetical protein